MNRITLPRAWIAMLLALVLASGCASVSGQGSGQDAESPQDGFRAPVSRDLPVAPAGPANIFYVDDPLEPFNRRIYDFNARFDEYVYLPVVRAYETALPPIVQTGVSNVFQNLREPLRILNSLLQFKLRKAGVSTGRLALNTTCGLLGLVDVATPAGLDRQDEDFGQTLGVWGVSAGPYIVLPILGPSNLRDTAGLAVDGAVYYAETIPILDLVNEDYRDLVGYSWAATEAIDARRRQSFRYYQTASPFEYSLVRFLYMRKRALDVEK